MPEEIMPEVDLTRAAGSGQATKAHTKWAYNVVALFCVLPALIGSVIYFVRLSNENQAIGVGVLWAGATPAMVFVFYSLIRLGAAATYRPLVSRDSVLWSWLNFMGRGSAGVLLLVSGSLVGGLVGTLASTPSSDLTALLTFAVVVVAVWLALLVAVWTIRAAVDIFRLELPREEIIGAWLAERGARHVERKAALFALGSELTAVIAAGVIMWVLIAVAFVGVVGFSNA